MQKVLLDEPSHLSSVRNALEGLSLIFPNQLQLIQTTTSHNDDQTDQQQQDSTMDTILLRKNHDNTKFVSLISGGGSGHSPSHESFVAKGMLTAAVCGAVFTSPSTSQIYRAIQAVTRTNKQNGKGCLLIVKNYTGDILNFKLAREMALQNDYHVEMIVVGDDVTHQRGVAGTVFVHKLCGAMADDRYTLNDIMNVMKSFQIMSSPSLEEISFDKPFIRSIGVGLNSITLPGHSEPLYDLKDTDAVYELGLGIHGEKGVSRLEYPNVKPATEISQIMLKQLIPLDTMLSTTVSHEKKKCALMINNLGSTTLLEIYNIVKIVVTMLQQCNFVLERIYVGTFMTALDMHGISLTLLNLGATGNEKILQFLDWKTDSIFWPDSFKLISLEDSIEMRHVSYLTVDSQCDAFKGETCNVSESEHVETFGKLLEIICNHIESRYQYYNSLDSAVGDGDFGDSAKRAVKHIRIDILTRIKSIESMQELFYRIGTSIQQAGGSSGAIISMFFLKYARSLRESIVGETMNFRKRNIKAFQEGVQGMMEIGDAKVGDKTLLDTLIPISDFLERIDLTTAESSMVKSHLSQAILDIAQKGMLSTKDMLAKRGRARYLGERVIGHIDPGAFCMFEIVELWAKWFSGETHCRE
nr:unnamed protein product [Naegleria fowleri]